MKSKIYLAGGFKGGWHNLVMHELKDFFTFFNPQKHNLDEVKKYTTWDLYHVGKADIILGYMSSTNPSGYGLALEIGYAKALGKLVILVDERSPIDETFARYFSICHESANITFLSLSEAIQYLQTF